MNRSVLGPPTLLCLVACVSLPVLAAPPEPAAAPPAAATARPSRKELVRRILPHNVRVLVSETGKVRRTASGVVIGRERAEPGAGPGAVAYVVTNAHAVDTEGFKAPSLVVAVDGRGSSSEYAAQVVAVGSVPDMDLALLRVSGLTLPPAQLAADEELEPGEEVVVAAAPFGRALSLSGGMVSQVEWDAQAQRPSMLKTDAPIGYGASGGGIFSLETGRLLAIVEGYRTAKVGFEVAKQSFSFDVPMPGETFAAPSGKVRRFLQSRGFAHLLASAPPEAAEAQTAQR